MRKEMKRTKQRLLRKLLVLPLLATMVFVTISMGLKIRDNKKKPNNIHNNININVEKQNVKSSTTQQQQQQQQQHPLPKWIIEYVQWHQEMRAKFPGDELFTNPDAPKLLVRTCLGMCGGLHDRLGQLPWDIYLAMRLNRVLLIAWQRPRSLENFLLPPVQLVDNHNDSHNRTLLAIDWRIPTSQNFGFDDIRRVRSEVQQLFDDNLDRNPGEGDFWKIGFEKNMVRAGAPPSPVAAASTENFERESKFFDTKIIRHRLLGHLDENILEVRLHSEGYYRGEPHWTPSDLHKAPTFGVIWDLFFRPSPQVRTEIVGVMGEMGLLRDSERIDEELTKADAPLPPTMPFTAVHCRVRHPKAHPPGGVVKGKNENYPADKTGLPWVEGGHQRAFALETANKALVCAGEILRGSGETKTTTTLPPVYFLSDSNDLVNHVAVELANTTYLNEHGSNSSWVNPQLLETVRSQHIVARNTTLENAHIDRQKGRMAPAYYATFVDLYLAMKARCVVYGIGYYAAFAAKISGTDCAYLYAKESWGAQVEKSAHVCTNHEIESGSKPKPKTKRKNGNENENK
jgi:hypothetical protein